MDPSIWPMRVKVREYIYYSKKPQHNAGQRVQGGGQYWGHHGVQVQGGQDGRQYQGPLGPRVGHADGQYGGHIGVQGGEQHQGQRGSQWGQDGGQHREQHGAILGHGGDQHQGHIGGQEGVPTFNRFEMLDTRP